jgi:dephospho-CoA kinase
MLLVGLTGGIGAGKSTVAHLLEERGAVVFDADTFARLALDRGTPGYEQVVEAFGSGILDPKGDIDRRSLAATVFHDPEARRRLEAIVHPEVARQLHESLDPYRGSDRIVVYSVPLLVEAGLESAFDLVVAVSAPEEIRVSRVARDRGMSDAEASERIRAQVSDQERETAADLVIRNDGTVDELEREVDRLWIKLKDRAGARDSTAPDERGPRD